MFYQPEAFVKGEKRKTVERSLHVKKNIITLDKDATLLLLLPSSHSSPCQSLTQFLRAFS